MFRWLRQVPLTRRAARHERTRVLSMPAPGSVLEVTHVLPVPRGACPVSGNPLSGTATVSYTPKKRVAEVVSLLGALRWACGNAAGAPKSVEDLAAWLAQETHEAVSVGVHVTLELRVRPGPQTLRVVARAG